MIHFFFSKLWLIHFRSVTFSTFRFLSTPVREHWVGGADSDTVDSDWVLYVLFYARFLMFFIKVYKHFLCFFLNLQVNMGLKKRKLKRLSQPVRNTFTRVRCGVNYNDCLSRALTRQFFSVHWIEESDLIAGAAQSSWLKSNLPTVNYWQPRAALLSVHHFCSKFQWIFSVTNQQYCAKFVTNISNDSRGGGSRFVKRRAYTVLTKRVCNTKLDQ